MWADWEAHYFSGRVTLNLPVELVSAAENYSPNTHATDPQVSAE